MTSMFVIFLFILQGFYYFIGLYASRKSSNSQDYFLASKGVRCFPLMMTFLATQVGGGLILGAAEEASQYGWSVLLYPFGQGLGLVFLGLGMGRKLAEMGTTTVAEIFETAYGSKILRRFASGLSVFCLFMILIAQVLASRKFMLSLGFDQTALFILFWVIVILYTSQGGLKAVISTDIAQASVFSIMLIVSFVLVFNSESLSSNLKTFEFTDFSVLSTQWSGWLLMPFLFMLVEQDMGQRCFAAESPKTASRAALFAGIATLCLCIVPVYFGTLSKTLGLNSVEGSSVLMTLINLKLSPMLAALMGCAIMAAIISTASSLISAISSNLACDFNTQIPMNFVKILTFAFSISAIVCAFYFKNVVNLLILSYELSVACLFVPILFAVLKKRGNKLSAWLSVVLGCVGFVVFRYESWGLPKEVLTLLLSGLGFALGYVYPVFKLSQEQKQT